MRTIKDKDNIEYLHSNNLGYAVKTRVAEAVANGWLIRDEKNKDYQFSFKTLRYQNFWLWLQGDNDKLIDRQTKTKDLF